MKRDADLPAVLAFGPFRLDEANARLLRDGQAQELPPKAFTLLCRLAAEPGRLFTKDELLDAVWGRRHISDSVLKTAINNIRATLQDDARAPRYIETVPRRGYRFLVSALPQPTAEPAPVLASAPPPAERAAAALIGRGAEFDAMCSHAAAALAGQPQLVLVSGEAGVGKSRLIDHFSAHARTLGFQVAVGQCAEQTGGGEPYLPLLDAISALCRGPQAAAWLRALREVAPTWLAQLPWLVAEADRSALQSELAGAAPMRMLREFAALLDRVAPQQPVLIVIEDMHWGDHASIGLLGYLARRRNAAAPWLLLASFRPADLVLAEHPMLALRHELRLHRLCHDIALESFTEVEVRALLQQRLQPPPGPEAAALARTLQEHTEGLPLFLVNLLDELLAAGTLAHDCHGRWALPGSALASLHVPDSIAGIVERQISRLPGEMRQLLEAASVAGAEFVHPLLARLLDQGAAALQQRCDGLARRGEWLQATGMATLPDGTLAFRYAFCHVLYRRVFYERCAPAQRLQLHLAAAAALQGLFDGDGERHAGEVALHLERACEIAAEAGVQLDAARQQAVAARLRAAAAAAAVHAPADALVHYQRALALGPAKADQARIQARRADLLTQLGQGPAALQAAEAALALVAGSDDEALRGEVALRHVEATLRADRLDDAIETARALAEGRSPATAVQRVEAMLLQSDALRLGGRHAQADAVLKAAAAATPPDDLARRARIAAGRVMLHYQSGSLGEGLELADQALALYRQVGDRRGEALIEARAGVMQLLTGRSGEAELTLQRSLALSRAINDVDGQRSALLNLIKLHTDRGDTETGLALLEEGWNLAPDFESPVAECAFLHGYFYCNYLLGHLGAAWRDAARVLASAEGLKTVYWQTGSVVLVMDLYLHSGELAPARALLERELARKALYDVTQQWLKAGARMAWLLLAEGRPAEAWAQLETISARNAPDQPEDMALDTRLRAQARLALGDPEGALVLLAPMDGAATSETWAVALALRLQVRQAQTHHGNADLRALDADIERARAEIQAARMPALENLLLRRALIEALQWRGLPTTAEREAADALRQRLADSLADDAPRQARFLERFAAS